MSDMRAVAAGLRVPELANMDAQDVARRAVGDHERRSGAKASLTLAQVPPGVSLPVRIALFRALQEALSNATRHGQSATIGVELSGRPALRPDGPPGLELVVRDDGTGFDPALLTSSEGLGLAGIREQAEILGGSFTVRSAPGGGTELRVWWPTQAPGADA
jgi:signal transduction histidine kinase